ncbi:MAG: transposase [Clostridia bacterium]|nr:transposase [Clostridia bacterium]
MALSVNTIKYIIARVIDNANDEDPKDRSEFTMGRRLAYYEILDTIKNELIAHEQDLGEFGLDFNLEERFL